MGRDLSWENVIEISRVRARIALSVILISVAPLMKRRNSILRAVGATFKMSLRYFRFFLDRG